MKILKYLCFLLLVASFCVCRVTAGEVYKVDPYIAQFAQHLRAHSPEIPEGKKVNLKIWLTETGEIVDVSPEGSVYDKEFAESAIKNIKEAAPYPKLSEPKGFIFTYKKDFSDLLEREPNWVDTKNSKGEKIYIDLYRASSKNQGLFYNLKTYVPSKGEDMVYTVHVKYDKELRYGISQKFTLKEFMKNPDKYEAKYAPDAEFFKSVNKASPSYDALVLVANYFKAQERVNPYWKNYIPSVQKRVKKNWKYRGDSKPKQAVLFFKVSKDGKLLFVKVVESSENEDFDNIAVNAVKSAAPFEPFPENVKSETIDILFTFNYNTNGSNISYANNEDREFTSGLLWLSSFVMALFML